MEDIAVRLFKLSDLEDKGFIVKRDMQRLRSEVSLSPEQLEAVFDSLDSCDNGYLTLEQFLNGLNTLKDSLNESSNCEHELARSLSVHLSNIEEKEVPVSKLLNLNLLQKSGELIHEMNVFIETSTSEQLQESWQHLLHYLCVDLTVLQKQVADLEEMLRTRSEQHKTQIRKLFDEMEVQLCEEREKQMKERKQKESEIRTELMSELLLKDDQIAELIEHRNELLDRLNQLQSHETDMKQQNAQLIKGQVQLIEKQDNELEKQQSLTARLQYSLDKLKKEAAIECKRKYEEGFRQAQRLAIIEEEGLVLQLQLLKQMQATLTSGVSQEKETCCIAFDDI